MILLLAFLLALGALLALFNPQMLVGEGGAAEGASRILAGYLFSRNLSVAAVLVLCLVVRLRTPLCAVTLLTALIQFVDVAVDCYEKRFSLIPGIAVIGVVALLAANRTLGGPVWKLNSWGRS